MLYYWIFHDWRLFIGFHLFRHCLDAEQVRWQAITWTKVTIRQHFAAVRYCCLTVCGLVKQYSILIVIQDTFIKPMHYDNPDITLCQTSNIRCTSVGNKLVDHSDVVRASPVGTAPTGFNGLGKGNCKMRRETFKFLDLVWLIIEVKQYFHIIGLSIWLLAAIWMKFQW